MIDETATQSSTAGTTGPGEGSAETVVAFCQQCGRALTTSTRRQVGAGIFCEPCATVRQTQSAGWAPVNPGAAPYTPGTPTPGAPNPALAGFLGLIPGVGAMYNGQYAKGVIHLIVFVVLVSLADNLNWVIWWLVWGWIFYQAIEAYHTAQARRDGLPIPDPFGWNELGERFGFARPVFSSVPRNARPPAAPPYAPPPPERPVQTTAGAAGFEAQPFASPFAAPAPPPPPMSSAPPSSTPYTQVPYSSTFAGPVGGPIVQPGLAGAQRFPAGAVWLIALGVLFLLGNLMPEWRITGRWLVPVLLAGIAFWIGARRITGWQTTGGVVSPSMAGALLAPCILLTLAVLLAMQDAYWISLKHSWPALLIVWGALLLLERSQRPSIPAVTAETGAPLGSTTPPSSE